MLEFKAHTSSESGGTISVRAGRPVAAALLGTVVGILGILMLVRYCSQPMWVHSDFLSFRNNEAPYPPLGLVFFRSFRLVDPGTGYAIWSMMSMGAYFGGIWLLVRLFRLRLAPPNWILLVGIALAWYPFLAHMALGQVSLVLFALLVGGWGAVRSGRAWLGGALFGLATAFKLFPGLTLFYLVLTRRWQALVSAIVTVVLGLLLPWAAIAIWLPDLQVLQSLATNASEYGLYPTNISLNAFLGHMLAPGPWINPLVNAPRLVQPLVMLIGTLSLAWLGLRCHQTPGHDLEDDAACFAYILILMTVLSPISWQHGLLLAWFPLLLLLREQVLRPYRPARYLAYVAFLCFSLPDIDIARALMARYEPYRVPWLASWPLHLPIAGLVLLIAALALQGRYRISLSLPSREAVEGVVGNDTMHP